MIKEVKLPEISENIEQATVINILVSKGDQVEEDQSLIEIETDKAASDVPSPFSGIVKEIMAKENEEIDVGGVILTIETESKTKEEDKEESEEQSEEKENEKKEKATDQKDKKEDKAEAKEDEETEAKEKDEDQKKEEKSSEPDEKDETPVKSEEKEKNIPVAAAPSVRRFAREIGLDIHDVKGSGPGGRISIDDVKAHSKKQNKGTQQTGFKGYSLPDFSKWGETERKPMGKVREITAENTLQSWNSVPHVTQFDKADVTGLEEFRKKYSKTIEKQGGKLTVTAIILKLAGLALQNFPKFISSLDIDEKEIIYKKYIHISVAVDTDRGLLVPVIRDVDKKSITELAIELGEMAKKARDKKISPDELQGGNFTISNLGGLGGTNFTPVVFPPQVAILGIAKSQMEPVFIDGEFKPRLMLPLNLSYDHRVIDGADGARFLTWLKNGLENPISMFLK